MREEERALGGPWTALGAVPVTGGVIAYAACGNGPPVVLLHKLGGWLQDWRALAAELADRYRVVALDLPGHGSSLFEEPAGWEFPIESGASAVEEALDSLGIARAAIVGNSLGGCVAVQVAVDRPDLVRKLVLISCALGPAASREAIEAASRQSGFYDADGLPLPRDAARIAQISGTHDIRIAEEMNASRAVAGRWVAKSERGVGLADFPALLPRVGVPTLLVYGERDTLIDRFEAPSLAALRHGSSVRIPGAGRFPQQEQPRRTAEAIVAFVG
ncbi:MAG: alpha/beta fold hydrolase [Chloroflexota bacterium]|nr:alpha/beta fold hydrolase [Dehalococcoidia bacterium]MDW8253424.1 alpha/beta fold hydrolase [Chloroflexota bacterium]